MPEDPKETIYIDISSCVGRGKTSTALILQKHLEDLGMTVEVRDVDLDSGPYIRRTELLKRAIESKGLKKRNIIIRTRQLPRDPQRGPDGEVPPGKF